MNRSAATDWDTASSLVVVNLGRSRFCNWTSTVFCGHMQWKRISFHDLALEKGYISTTTPRSSKRPHLKSNFRRKSQDNGLSQYGFRVEMTETSHNAELFLSTVYSSTILHIRKNLGLSKIRYNPPLNANREWSQCRSCVVRFKTLTVARILQVGS
jgi:hypothetical protein